MARVSLDLLKKHVRATAFDHDDAYLLELAEMAEQQVINATGYTREEWSVVPDEAFPADLKHAILMRAATRYAYREDIDNSNLTSLPNSLMAIVKPYQKMRGGSLTDKLITQYTQE
jgi:plasmid stabilization system protein ParE